MAYQPPFEQTDAIVNLVANIALKLGKVESTLISNMRPQLRKENRIRTIHSSLAIENNTLTLDQVTAVLEGKHVIAPQRDILEVQNALAAYELIGDLDPFSANDLLRAHGVLMAGLASEAGRFRSGNVGVFDGSRLVHAGTPAAYVPEVIADLFGWIKSTSCHPLVASCAFHYEFEFIHPFQDGNGRMGRLWQTLILAAWNPLFAWLPVESIVKERQSEYYKVLGHADLVADCTEFIEFMLTALSDALDSVLASQHLGTPNVGDNVGENVGEKRDAPPRDRVLSLISQNPSISARSLAEHLSLSSRQVERMLAALKAEGVLARIGSARGGHWVIKKEHE